MKQSTKQQQNNLFVYCIKPWTNTRSNNQDIIENLTVQTIFTDSVMHKPNMVDDIPVQSGHLFL